MSKAAPKLNLPFGNVWAKMKDAERQAEFKIVETTKTGSGLTAEGQELLALFSQLSSSCNRSARGKIRQIFSLMGTGNRVQQTVPFLPSWKLMYVRGSSRT
jgi:molybdenum-dependent DNA-binding transcriptional regulator ModE